MDVTDLLAQVALAVIAISSISLVVLGMKAGIKNWKRLSSAT